MNTIFNCDIIELKINNRAGNISVVENNLSIPFKINRVYYIYDVPGGLIEGMHIKH